MSTSESKLIPKTETEKLLAHLESMLKSLKGPEPGSIDYKNVHDGFDKLRYRINDKLNNAETLLAERDKLMNSVVPKEIYERNQLKVKIENLWDDIPKDLKDLEVELTAQKRKRGKYTNLENKDEMLKWMKTRGTIWKNKWDGVIWDEDEIVDNRTNIEKLDVWLQQREAIGAAPQRELYDEEKQQIEAWNREVKEQDEALEEVHNAVKNIKQEVKIAGKNIEAVGRKAKEIEKHTDKTTVKLETQNTKLKNLLKKIRSGDRICVDILLILILCGWIAVLYSLIKKRL